MVNVLYVVVVLERVQHLKQLVARLGIEMHGVLGKTLYLGGKILDTRGHECVTHRRKLIDRRKHLICVIVRDIEIVRSGVKREHHHLVVIHACLFLDLDHAFGVEIVRHASGRPEASARAIEDVTNFSACSVFIVRERFHYDGDTVGTVALVYDAFIVDIAQLATCLLDAASDVVFGHVVGFGLIYYRAKCGVGVRVRASGFDCYRYLSSYLRKDLASCGVCFTFCLLDIVPFGMSRHISYLTY